MAKEQFQRTKPHVNAARLKLRQAGMSTMGIQQLLGGSLISSAQDRALVAEIVQQAISGIRAEQLNNKYPD